MGFEQRIKLDDEVFDELRGSTDAILQRLIKDMIDKGSSDGKVTITIGVSLAKQFRANKAEDNAQLSVNEDTYTYTPTFKYKVGSVMQIKNDLDGSKDYDGMEVVFDEALGEYVIKPITGLEQMSIFDAEFKEYFEDKPQLTDTHRIEDEDDEPADIASIEELPFGDKDDDYQYEENEEYGDKEA